MDHSPNQGAESGNRRLHDRHDTDLGCKIKRSSVARYIAARTENVSAGGAMLTIDTARPLAEGERIEIGVNWSSGGLLRTGELVSAVVLRATPLLESKQRIAVRFDEAQAKADALAAAAAA